LSLLSSKNTYSRKRERRERKKERENVERAKCCITIKNATPGILTLSIRALNTVVLGVIILNVVAPTKLIRS
jgi:hypothetical protein